MNVVDCAANGREIRLPGHGALTAAERPPGREPVRLGIRPEHIEIVDPKDGHCRGTVEVAEHLGSDTFLYVTAESLGTFTIRTAGRLNSRPGDIVGLRFSEKNVHLFDTDDRAIRAALTR